MVRLIFILFVGALSLVACGDDESTNFVARDSESELDGSSSSTDLDNGHSSGKSSSSNSSDSKVDDEKGSSSSINKEFQDLKDSIKLDFNEVYGTTISFDSVYSTGSDYYYKTVQIGGLVWIAENVRGKELSGKCYDRDQSICDAFGRLYKSYPSSCPSGFNIPTKEQWENLFEKANGVAALKSKAAWEKSSSAVDGTNALGFSILPAGVCTKDSCWGLFKMTNFMVSNNAGYYTITNDKKEPEFHEGYDSTLYYSVRCVKQAKIILTKDDLPTSCKKGDRILVSDDEIYDCYDGKWYREINKS